MVHALQYVKLSTVLSHCQCTAPCDSPIPNVSMIYFVPKDFDDDYDDQLDDDDYLNEWVGI